MKQRILIRKLRKLLKREVYLVLQNLFKKEGLYLGLLFLFPLFSSRGEDPSNYIQKANHLKLYKHKEWKKLLHDSRSLFFDISEADSDQFFLSKNGKRNYKEELIVLLKNLLSSEKINDDHGLCRFPARSKWLLEKLGLKFDRKKLEQCPAYQEFLNLVGIDSVTLIFSSYFMESPASAFGHTLLRFGRKRTSHFQDTKLLDMGINYSAKVTTNNAFLYALFGLTGVFEGHYSAIPYYYKLREYNDFESRDLWEYDLNLNHQQRMRLRDHLWEVGNTFFYYYYFSENCSYNLLSLLEVANFNLDLIDKLPFLYTIPSHTVEIINSTPGLVKKRRSVPSAKRRFDFLLKKLNKKQRQLMFQSYDLKNENIIFDSSLDEGKKINTIDTLIEYIDYIHPKEVLLDEGKLAKWKREILKKRSESDIPFQIENLKISDDEAIHKAHGIRRITLGLLGHDAHSYDPLFGYRFAMHDFLDYRVGSPANSTLEFLDILLSEKKGRFRLSKLDLLEVMTLNPISEYKMPASFKVKVGWKRSNFFCQDCLIFSAHLGGGGTISKGAHTFYSLLNILTESSSRIKGRHRVYSRFNFSYKYDFNNSFTMHLEVGRNFFFKKRDDLSFMKLGLHFYLSKKSKLEFFSYFPENMKKELIFSIKQYF